MKLVGLILAATVAFGGPLTIQTEQATWTNGLDTITLDAATVEGPGLISIPFAFEFAAGPRSESISFTQNATIGDSDAPVTLLYSATYEVFPAGFASFLIEIQPSIAPYTELANPDPQGRHVRIVNGPNSAVLSTSPVEGNAQGIVQLATPEPSSLILIALGLGTIYGRKFAPPYRRASGTSASASIVHVAGIE